MCQSSFQPGLKLLRAITWDFSDRTRVAQAGLKLFACNRDYRFSRILSESRAEILHVISPYVSIFDRTGRKTYSKDENQGPAKNPKNRHIEPKGLFRSNVSLLKTQHLRRNIHELLIRESLLIHKLNPTLISQSSSIPLSLF